MWPGVEGRGIGCAVLGGLDGVSCDRYGRRARTVRGEELLRDEAVAECTIVDGSVVELGVITVVGFGICVGGVGGELVTY